MSSKILFVGLIRATAGTLPGFVLAPAIPPGYTSPAAGENTIGDVTKNGTQMY